MPLAGSEVDANFFNLIHRVLAEQPKRSPAERRGPERKCYQALARIALRRDANVPPESDFFEVQCHDLTRHGFSFLLPYQPAFQEVAACFGAPPDAIYLAARVAHSAEVLAHDQGRGRPMFLIGCEFLERLQR